MKIFLTGATGYIGGRLAPRLIEAGHSLRCLSRSPRKLDDELWSHRNDVEVVQGDMSDADELAEQMRGCDAAYYLVHSMVSAGDTYAEKDRQLARNFATAAEKAGVKRMIYLGGLGEMGEDLSAHLRSRREVEKILAESSVPLTSFRAAMIIGSGSASFEILRYLVERLPVMLTPRWVRTECQPIAVRNVLHYLVACLDVPETAGRELDIGGPDVVTYRRLMRIMQEERGLPRRLVIPVPVLTPKLSSLWIHVITPISSKIARPLAEGLKNRVVVENHDAERLMPQRLLSCRESIAAALGKLAAADVETSWSDAGPIPTDPDWAGGKVFVDARSREVDASAEAAFTAACRIGGGRGYHSADFLWTLRGVMDRVIGGPGLRRGRRDPDEIAYGDAIDFWRVTGIEEARLLELRAEMKVPGIATLTFEMEPTGENRCTLTQTARFKPKGLLGLGYWYAVLPLHGIVFNAMLAGIATEAEEHVTAAEAEAAAG
jgi:uncharacterized protein YbjT (DUF2867 family)